MRLVFFYVKIRLLNIEWHTIMSSPNEQLKVSIILLLCLIIFSVGKVSNMKRILTVSDIHGFSEALNLLLKASKYSEKKDQLILLGDYINKGPASNKTLKNIRKLHNKGAVALLGNNELKVLREKDKQYADWFKFLKKLPVSYQLNNYLFSHAGFRAGVTLENQKIDDLTGYHKEWFPQASFENMTTIHGHTPTFRLGADKNRIHINENTICIDTGAGHKRYLSLLDVTNRRVYKIDVVELGKVKTYDVNF